MHEGSYEDSQTLGTVKIKLDRHSRPDPMVAYRAWFSVGLIWMKVTMKILRLFNPKASYMMLKLNLYKRSPNLLPCYTYRKGIYMYKGGMKNLRL